MINNNKNYIKKMLTIFMLQLISKLYPREECSICFENRNLKQFCKSHKFCDKCCSAWSKTNNLCPLCRDICVNKKYVKYNYGEYWLDCLFGTCYPNKDEYIYGCIYI